MKRFLIGVLFLLTAATIATASVTRNEAADTERELSGEATGFEDSGSPILFEEDWHGGRL